MQPRSKGFLYAFAAYLAWGFLPLYFKALRGIPAPEVLAHRVVWSVVLLAAVVVAARRGAALREALARGPRGVLATTSALIAGNWLLYIWAIQSGRVVEASLGYFVNPLVNVLLGVVFLGEPLSVRQRGALALAGAGVLALVVRLGTFPWVALLLALTFGLYGLLRKRAAVDPLAGLLVETTFLVPLALALLLARAASGAGAFGHGLAPSILLALAGPITAIPLVWFAVGVQRLRLSTMGLIQYVAPTCQFLLGVVLYREPFTRAHALAFGLIWSSLVVYSWDLVVTARRLEVARAAAASTEPPPEPSPEPSAQVSPQG
ncbi:EamA family transporter RarD [Anaeromyxobacter oryzisoli]|uniref:EamA family transporter RarD n=1 Tax=Anaeromyxobacter oryzisoli TaxID=2925408 RepID=UPI001F584D55|nr:EamA family transporter RarD [Anaeromyxobacter sp. SG63]